MESLKIARAAMPQVYGEKIATGELVHCADHDEKNYRWSQWLNRPPFHLQNVVSGSLTLVPLEALGTPAPIYTHSRRLMSWPRACSIGYLQNAYG